MPFVSMDTRRNPRNFSNIELDLCAQGIYYNDIFQYNTVPRFRGYAEEQFYGEEIVDFHRNRNAGKLLPYTAYHKSSAFAVTGGPSVLSAGYTGFNVKWKWSDGSTKPVLGNMDPIDYDRVLKAKSEITSRVDVNDLVQAAAAKIYSRGWDGLTFLAEFHQVVRMFRRAGKQFLSLLTDPKNIKQNFSSIDEWLATRYGWRILLYDIQDINKLIEDLDKKQLTRVKDRVGEALEFSYVWDTLGTGGHRPNIHNIVNVEASVRGVCIADFAPARVRINPVATAWELMTFSFVVDWFINVGRALDAISLITLSSNYSSAYGFYFKTTRTSVCDGVTYDSYWGARSPYSNWTEISMQYEDEVFCRVPMAVPTFPSWDLNLNAFKVADLIALILQFIRKLL